MPKPRPLTSAESKKALVLRLGSGLVDRLRQFNTKFGIRPYRVFLVWTVSSGVEVGEGNETEYKRIEILPTPKVNNPEALANPASLSGMVPTGNLRVTEVSLTLDANTLNGYLQPTHRDKIPDPYNFFYEVVEDQRHEELPQRARFRLSAPPALGSLGWTLLLERSSEDRSRGALSRLGTDADE